MQVANIHIDELLPEELTTPGGLKTPLGNRVRDILQDVSDKQKKKRF